MSNEATTEADSHKPAEVIPQVSLPELSDLCVDNQDYVNHIMELLPSYITKYCKPKPYSMVKNWYLEQAIKMDNSFTISTMDELAKCLAATYISCPSWNPPEFTTYYYWQSCQHNSMAYH